MSARVFHIGSLVIPKDLWTTGFHLGSGARSVSVRDLGSCVLSVDAASLGTTD